MQYSRAQLKVLAMGGVTTPATKPLTNLMGATAAHTRVSQIHITVVAPATTVRRTRFPSGS